MPSQSRLSPINVRQAARAGDLLTVAAWLDQGDDMVNSYGGGLLIDAATGTSSAAVVHDLIARGCDLEFEAWHKEGEASRTALEIAVYYGNFRAVALLLDAGATRDTEAATLALSKRDPVIMSLLMRHARKTCSWCARPGAKKRCARCVEEKLVPACCFCSEECMRAAWPGMMRGT